MNQTIDAVTSTAIIRYSPDAAEIATFKERFTGLDATTDYEGVRGALAELRTARTTIEKSRVQFKADALEYGRKVDKAAAALTMQIRAIEEPLIASKRLVDDEKERLAREIVEAEKARLKKIEDDARTAEEAKLKAERDREEERIRQERMKLAEEHKAARLERERLDAERKAAQDILDAENRRIQARLDEERRAFEVQRREQAARDREAREKLEAEQVKLRAEQVRLERIDFEKQAMARAEQDAMERRKREIHEAELRRVADEIERKRRDEAKPDVAKVQAFGRKLGSFVRENCPALKSEQAKALMAAVETVVMTEAAKCLAFKVNGKGKANG